MAFSSLGFPLSSFFPSHSSSLKFSNKLYPNSLLKLQGNTLLLSSSSSSQFSPASEQALLEAVVESDAKSLPAVRTYENDLARLTVVGSVDLQQALTAAAADGGEAADEHISSGTAAMVVETIFPGPFDEHSTISTRLFLPARKVKEKAIKLKKSMTKDIFASTTSKNILAMTFRQVVLQQLWNFELEIFSPGRDRDMNNLENPKEVPAILNFSSSDKQIISVIAEVICLAALENTERIFLRGSTNRASNKLFHWFNKPKEMSSRDSSVILYNLLDHHVLANAKTLAEKFNLERSNYKLKESKLKKTCWRSLTFSKLETIGGPEFCSWISECVPSYILKIDACKFSDVKIDGWKKQRQPKWEVFLTHSQLISLADTLDMYYEDVFTLPSKRLSCSAVASPSNLALNKRSSMLNLFSVALASGIFLVAISVVAKINLPHLPSMFAGNKSNSFSCLQIVMQKSSLGIDRGLRFVEPRVILLFYRKMPVFSFVFKINQEVESCCVEIIRRLKNYFGWPGDVSWMNHGHYAWIGKLPSYLSVMDNVESNIIGTPSISKSEEAGSGDMKALQDIASYQVVLSPNGNILGFQPTNRVAVNNWAANPLAKELYGGKNLSPGLFEPGLQISYPNDVLVLKLLMSANPESCFALVRTDDSS
ncbi:LOW QUALITY PROTEIN: uncharacterized protein [Primulina eburnea]|uniref:LOW QUALITY PROTEIN: uncharacterized protein n=1 Tax=Primulina eburnea TaxID=1245227 RepID=UPI003C6C52B3